MEKEPVHPLLVSSVSKRGYRCQRCRNHNVDVARKGHVDQCPFRACRCSQCVLVERRTDTHRLLKQKAIMNNVFEKKQFGKSGSDSKGEPLNLASALSTAGQRPQDRRPGLDGAKMKHEKRTLRCAKCSNHDVHAPLKNHKQSCPYRNCLCSMCYLVDDYRNILKDQIKTRRMQSRQRALTAGLPARPIRSSQPKPIPKPETLPSPVSDTPSSPIRKSVIVSSSSSPKTFSSESTESLPPVSFEPSLVDTKSNSMLLLSHLAALSALWQQQQSPTVGIPLPFIPSYNFYGPLSHGLHMQMS